MAAHPLEPIFHPRAIALVGVSSTGNTMSGGFLHALIEHGYQDAHGLYPVNPKMQEISGLRCYPSLLDTPDPVDHVISLVPARVVPQLVEQAITKRVRSIHFYTAGFSETGDPAAVRAEAEMVARLRAAGIRALGPNCMGLYIPAQHVSFQADFPRDSGHVMVISQSGANASDAVSGLSRRGVRFSKVISFGNGADLRAHDLFDYAAQDDETTVVAAYVEGVQDGRLFFDAVRRCAAVKPTILLKGGLTAAGARAARSHTGSLAGSVQIFEAMCRQAGAFRAETMDELQDLVVALTTSARRVRGRGVALVSGGGGFAVLSSDAIATAGLEVPPTPEATRARMREFVPTAGTSINNPIDTPLRGDDLDRLLRTTAEADAFDVVFTSPITGMRRNGPSTEDTRTPEEREAQARERALAAAEQVSRLQEETGTPFVWVTRERMAPAPGGEGFLQEAYNRGVATYPSVARAARTIALLHRWRAQRAGLPEIL